LAARECTTSSNPGKVTPDAKELREAIAKALAAD
jgi:hypothetical protein